MNKIGIEEKTLNTPHYVQVGAPLLRPGLTITCVCSERYVVEVTNKLMNIVRKINDEGCYLPHGMQQPS